MNTPRESPDDSISPSIVVPSAAHPFGGKTAADTSAERTAGLTDNSLMEAVEEPATTTPVTVGNAAKTTTGNVTDEDTQPVGQTIRDEFKYQVNEGEALLSRMTDRELLKREADEQKLAGVIQQRHHISLDKVRQQVKAFFVSEKS